MINVVIIDDEEGCISNLQYYLAKYCPEIRVVAIGSTITDAEKICRAISFDIAFLDIELGDEDIFSLLSKFPEKKFEIIFVTAHENYALKACKIQAIDYILKPLLSAEIVKCYQKILIKYAIKNVDQKSTSLLKQPKLLLRQGDNVYLFSYEDIYCFKASGGYTQIAFDYRNKHTALTISKPIGDLEKEYNSEVLFRVHKSYLVNCNKIVEIIKGDVMTLKLSNNQIIPIAKRRIHEFLTFLDSRKNIV